MTVKQIAKAAAAILQADTLENALGSPHAASDSDVKAMVACINSAAADIAADGFPVVVTETLFASDGRIPSADFSRRPSGVCGVRDRYGAAAFSFGAEGLAVARDGEYMVAYTVEPAAAGLDEEVERSELCSGSMLMYAAARNYCLVTGRADEAAVWDQMYDAHARAVRLKRRARMPKRRWR